MGDRVSIQFLNGPHGKSAVLSSHWRGMDLVDDANDYVKALKAERKGQGNPLDRFEADTVMVDFVRYLTTGMDRVESDLRLCCSEDMCDNSDNGHHVIDLSILCT